MANRAGGAEEAARLPSDEPARAAARGNLGRSAVVEAGAGTGKTTILVDRLVNLVVEAGAALDRVVAITFTEKAAGELKIRVRERLESRFAAEPAGERRDRLARALGALERAPIETIHAFSARLLRSRPVEAGVDPRFETLDELQTSLLVEELWREWLAGTLEDPPEALRRAWAVGLGPEAWQRLADALRRQRSWLDVVAAPGGAPPSAGEWIAGALPRLEAERDRLVAAARDPDDKLIAAVEESIRELASWQGAGEERAAAFLLASAGFPGGRIGSKASYRDPGALAVARAACEELAASLSGWRQRAGDHLLRGLAAAVWTFLARYERVKRERGLLDFEDLLLLARDLLAARPEARRDLARQWSHLLVDEFQDTDPLQAEILFLLCDETGRARSWREVEVPPGKLFLVGDPKQSIYRFRRADIELYEQAKSLLLGAEPPLAITENFRADGRLIEWVNSVFRDEMKRPADGAYQPEYRALTAWHRAAAGPPPVVWLELEAGDGERRQPAGERRAAEAAAVAGLVRKVVQEGWQVRVKAGERRPARAGDVALLLRAMTGAEHYEEAFRDAGIPYRIAGGKDYYRREEVQALLRLLEAIDDPGDAIAVVATLRSSLFGVEDARLAEHHRRTRGFDYTAGGAEDPAIGDAFACLAALRELRFELAPSELVREALARTHALALAALKPHGEQRVANLLKLADAADELGAAGLSSLRRVVRHLRELEVREVEEAESVLAEDGDDAVRIMTVHKSKGLEFPIVVLADLEHAGRKDRPVLLVDRPARRPELRFGLGERESEVTTAGWAGLVEAERRREEAEKLRTLYVALTRARDWLVLPLRAAAGRAEDGEALAPRLLGSKLVAEGGRPAAGVRRIAAGELERAPRAPALRHNLAPPFDGGEVADRRLALRLAWREERARALARASRGVVLLHPSKAAEDEPDAPPDEPFTGEREAIGAGARVGVAVHLALARIDLADPAAAAAVAADEAARAGLQGPAAARVLRLVAAALASPILAEAGRAGFVAREAPFAVAVDGVRIEGAADLVLETPGGLVLADWKTDAAAREGGSALDRLVEHYRPQALLYALGFERATRCAVVEVRLVFLDGPDGVAAERPVRFDAAAREWALARLRRERGESAPAG